MNRLTSIIAFTSLSLILMISGRLDAAARYTRHGATIVSGHVRIKFLTPTLVRMENSSLSKFTDDPTVVVVKRNWKKVHVSAEEKNGWLVVSSRDISVRYMIGSGRFNGSNLKVSWNYGGCAGTWVPGDRDSLNLGGTTSLDGVDAKHLPPPQEGVLSRSGYFKLNDSRSPVIDPRTKWLAGRADKREQDWYFLAYGHDYSHGLKVFSELCGKIPMIPRYCLGIWMTDLNYQYVKHSDLITNYHYTSNDLLDEINRFRSEGLPLDMLVMDFGWHKFGWQGGYDWSPIFKNPKKFLNAVHSEGIHVAVNDHPKTLGQSAISDHDSHANELRRLLSGKPKQKTTFNLELTDGWKFMPDTSGTGMLQSWESPDYSDSGWKGIETGKPWEEQGYPHFHNIGWYRKWVDIPADAPKNLYLIFGGVTNQYALYLNGKEVGQRVPGGEESYVNISDFVERGKRNLIVLQVNDWGNWGGITNQSVEVSNHIPYGIIQFDMADKRQAKIFMNVLHAPLMREGVNFWWIDGAGSAPIDGLDGQLWTNKVYYDFTRALTKKRALILSRYGGWGNERYPILFTGDTFSEWPMLAFQVGFTARGGNALTPYISNDIGGFHGAKLSTKLYCRWLEFGAFSPILRLHCSYENPANGNLRMPWVYGDTGIAVARKYFNLREELIPYIYTFSRRAYDDAMPILRPLYLEYPDLPQAYSFPDEYFLGSELLVSPVVDANDSATTCLPPGKWVDYFTGKVYEGNRIIKGKYPIDVLPLFVKQGSIIPFQDRMSYSYQRPLDTLRLKVYGPASGSFDLYEDDGTSLGYTEGRYSWSPLDFRASKNGGHTLSIGPTRGKFKGQVRRRAYKIEIQGVAKPRMVTMESSMDGHKSKRQVTWRWDTASSTIIATLPPASIRSKIELKIN